jgi:isocitrate lyase
MLTAPVTGQLIPYDPQPNGRWDGIIRPYSQDQVERLRGSVPISYTLADVGVTAVDAASR